MYDQNDVCAGHCYRSFISTKYVKREEIRRRVVYSGDYFYWHISSLQLLQFSSCCKLFSLPQGLSAGLSLQSPTVRTPDSVTSPSVVCDILSHNISKTVTSPQTPHISVMGRFCFRKKFQRLNFMTNQTAAALLMFSHYFRFLIRLLTLLNLLKSVGLSVHHIPVNISQKHLE